MVRSKEIYDGHQLSIHISRTILQDGQIRERKHRVPRCESPGYVSFEQFQNGTVPACPSKTQICRYSSLNLSHNPFFRRKKIKIKTPKTHSRLTSRSHCRSLFRNLPPARHRRPFNGSCLVSSASVVGTFSE